MKMKYPYLLYSDVHCHAWSSFSTINKDGVNSRLRITLDELIRAYKALVKAGGNTAFNAGDSFHTRGRLEPSVLNPVFQAFEEIHDKYSEVFTYIIPGNHDLQSKGTTALGNATQQLGLIESVSVDTKVAYHSSVIVVPWEPDLNKLRERLSYQAAAMKANDALETTDVIIHAPT